MEFKVGQKVKYINPSDFMTKNKEYKIIDVSSMGRPVVINDLGRRWTVLLENIELIKDPKAEALELLEKLKEILPPKYYHNTQEYRAYDVGDCYKIIETAIGKFLKEDQETRFTLPDSGYEVVVDSEGLDITDKRDFFYISLKDAKFLKGRLDKLEP